MERINDESRVLLEKRARALAREGNEAADGGERIDIVGFRLATESYGLPAASVREVLPLKDYTPLPGVPPFVLGIIGVRGRILSVVDLKKFFSLPERGLGESNQVIVIGNHRMEFGILTDAVLGTGPVPSASIQAAPPTVTGIGAEYLKGVTDGGVIVLDAERILDSERIIVNE